MGSTSGWSMLHMNLLRVCVGGFLVNLFPHILFLLNLIIFNYLFQLGTTPVWTLCILISWKAGWHAYHVSFFLSCFWWEIFSLLQFLIWKFWSLSKPLLSFGSLLTMLCLDACCCRSHCHCCPWMQHLCLCYGKALLVCLFVCLFVYAGFTCSRGFPLVAAGEESVLDTRFYLKPSWRNAVQGEGTRLFEKHDLYTCTATWMLV